MWEIKNKQKNQVGKTPKKQKVNLVISNVEPSKNRGKTTNKVTSSKLNATTCFRRNRCAG